jgi:hypothetical protein
MKAILKIDMPNTCNQCPCLWTPEYDGKGFCQALSYINNTWKSFYPTEPRLRRVDCPLKK